MLIDYHLHNHFSPDSEEDTRKIIEMAIKRGMQDICITNHVDWFDIFDLNESIERFKKIQEEIDLLQPEYGIPIRLGCELELMPGRMDELAEFVKQVPLDFVLGSVHHIDGGVISSHKYADAAFEGRTEEEAYHNYFDNMVELIDWGHFDVASHFDICKKYGHKFYGLFDPEKYKDRIIPILKMMALKNIGLELNTKCLHIKCKEIFPHPTILKWALEAGIKNFTLSSDAHTEADVSEHIKEALEIAKSVGIKEISTYYQRQAILHPIQ
ncbi:MAG: histidinol-phosphatase [Candidatus Peregrinibacteria bacterium]|nr:histidinol-phosphatase [Candidatus Peregrinibacteria bacterium]